MRISEADYTGKATTPEQYLLESIVTPNVFIIPGLEANIMPENYAQWLTPQNAADLIAYLQTLR
jgi:nitric oxide reductase subunit C